MQRFTHGGARHAQPFGQLAFDQPVTGFVKPGVDGLKDQVVRCPGGAGALDGPGQDGIAGRRGAGVPVPLTAGDSVEDALHGTRRRLGSGLGEALAPQAGSQGLEAGLETWIRRLQDLGRGTRGKADCRGSVQHQGGQAIPQPLALSVAGEICGQSLESGSQVLGASKHFHPGFDLGLGPIGWCQDLDAPVAQFDLPGLQNGRGVHQIGLHSLQVRTVPSRGQQMLRVRWP